MKSLYTSTITTLAVVLLAACDGSSDGGFSPPVQTAPVEITAANAAVVTSDSLNAASVASDMGDLAGPGMWSGLGKLPVAGVSKILDPVFEVSGGSITLDCLVSGTYTVTASIANPGTITVGDTVNAIFADCDDGEGEVLDGVMDITITAFTGSMETGFFQLGMSVLLDNLSMDDGSEVGPAVADGNFNLSVNTLSYPVTTTAVTGDLLSLVAAGRSLTMRDFSSEQQLDEGMFPVSYTMVASGAVQSSRFEGEASYVTIATFAGSGDSYPYEGVMLITGAANAGIWVTALDELNVRVEIDYDGDGAVDETRNITWEDAIS